MSSPYWLVVHIDKFIQYNSFYLYFLSLFREHFLFQSLGNHEFDDGIPGLVPFLDNVTFPCLAANIDDSNEPSIRGKVPPSVVLDRSGRKIGIIGYVTTETAVSIKLLLYDRIPVTNQPTQKCHDKS